MVRISSAPAAVAAAPRRPVLLVAASLVCLAISTGCGAPAAPTPAPPTVAAAAVAPPTAAPPTAAPPTAAPPTAAPPTAAPPPTAAAPVATAPPAAAATAPPAAAPAAAGTTPSADPRSALGEIFRGWTGVKTFRAKISGSRSGAGAGQTDMQMEVVLPDRVRGSVAVGGATMEMVMAGGSTYMKMPTGQWIKSPGAPVDLSTMDPKRYETEFRGNVANVSLVGPDVVDGTPALVYQYDIAQAVPPAGVKPDLPPPAGLKPGEIPPIAGIKPGEVPPIAGTKPGAPPAIATGPLHAKIWVGVADRLPRKLELTGGPGGTVTTVTYYDYNAPITIEPPIP